MPARSRGKRADCVILLPSGAIKAAPNQPETAVRMSDTETTPTPERPRRRRWPYWIAALVVVLAGLVALAVWYLPVIAAPIVRDAVARAGLEPVAFEITDIGWRSASLEAVEVGEAPDLTIARIGLGYTPADLLKGEVGRVTLGGVRLRARYGDDGLDLGALNPLLAGEGGTGGGIPVEHVAVEDAAIDLETAQGQVLLAFGGEANVTGDDLDVVLSARLSGDVARGQGEVRFTRTGGTSALTISDLLLEGRAPGLAGTLALEDARLDASLSGNVVTGTLASGLVFEADADAALPVAAADADFDGGFRYDIEGGEASLTLAACVPLAVTAVPDAGWEVGAVSLCPVEGQPAFRNDFSATGSLGAALDIPATSFTLDGTARGETPAMELRASGPLASPVIEAALAGGEARLTGQNVLVTGLRGTATVRLGGEGAAAELDLATARVTDLQAATRFSPLLVSGDLALDSFDSGTIRGPVRVASAGGRALGAGSLRHDLGTGSGRIDFDTGRLTFSDEGFQPQEIVPALSGVVAAVSGTARIAANLAWGPNGLGASGATVEMTNLGLQAPAARFAGVAGTLTFSNLSPIRTQGPQQITIGRVDAGVPLTGGSATFEVEPGGAVIVRNAQWPFAGGALVVTSEALNTNADVQRAQLKATGLSLGELLVLIDLDGLSGNGTLGGTVPIEIRDGTVYVVDAVLEAEPGGAIKYQSQTSEAAAESAEGASIAFRALENFQFRVLRLEVDGPTSGDLAVRVLLEGSNPAVYDGYPIRLNLNTEGPFMQLIQRSTAGFRPLDVVTGRETLDGVEVERVGPEDGGEGQ